MSNLTEGSSHISVKTAFHITIYTSMSIQIKKKPSKLLTVQMPYLKVSIWSSLSAYS